MNEERSIKSIHHNLAQVYQRVDAIDLDEGRQAYTRYHDLMQALADYHGTTIEKMTACFVVTSPNNDYMKNLRSAVSVVRGYLDGFSAERITVSTYGKCKTRAYKVMAGADFLDFTKGQKTRSFYRNILDPYDPDPVTIDGHMLAMAVGHYLTMREAVRSKLKYDDVVMATKLLAYKHQLLANQVQAILWFTWKRIHKPVRGDGQCLLFSPNDNWRLILDPKTIEPYPIKK